MQTAFFDSGLLWDNPNLRWGDPSYLLEPGDAGYVPPVPAFTPTPKRTRNYMASNATPDRLDELLAAGEDLCDGLNTLAVQVGIKQNTFAATRADLDALVAAQMAVNAAEGAQPAAYTALRVADSNGKGFIARAVKVLSISLGNDWSDAWEATGLPDNRVGVPGTQAKRFTALCGLKAYFEANPARENAALTVTAAIAGGLHTAISDARQGVGSALSLSSDKLQVRGQRQTAFRTRFRGTVNELEQLLDPEDPRWYDFGLNRPADPAQPGVPANVLLTALGSGRVLIQIDGARRANSFNYYCQVVNVDPEPVKQKNSEGTQYTIENATVGATLRITVTGVNDAGEGPASEPVDVVVT